MTVTASNFERRANELYETEEWATEALLRVLPVAGMTVWEPAAGNHKIARVLARHGASVITSDIATYEHRHDATVDFLEKRFAYKNSRHDAIITNPPYGKGNREAVKFCELALERCDGFVAMLLTAKFDFGKTRRHLFRDCNRFMAKVALLDRISWAGNGETGTEDHAWFIWGPDAYVTKAMAWEHKAPPTPLTALGVLL